MGLRIGWYVWQDIETMVKRLEPLIGIFALRYPQL